MIDKVLFGDKKTKKNYTFYLDKHINDKLEFLATKSGLTKGKVVSNLVEMFDTCYLGAIETINNCPADKDLNEWLIENGYEFLLKGKCNAEQIF